MIPLIVVSEDAIFSIQKAIALASDINNESDIHILEPSINIADLSMAGAKHPLHNQVNELVVDCFASTLAHKALL